MSHQLDTISPGGKPLSDEELMNLLIRVRRGELSPEEAERQLRDLPGFETDAAPGDVGQTEPVVEERSQPVGQTAEHGASAPLGQAKQGTLIVDTLAANFNIGSANLGPDLFRARYTRSFPSVWVDGNIVTARFNYFSLGALREWLRQQQGDHPRAGFTLNTAVPWQLELRTHMSNLDVNLHGVQLAGLEGNGSMNHITLSLDGPVGRVPIHYDAIASSVEIHCPSKCPLRVEVQGNTNAADVLGRKFASKSAWQTPDFDTAQNRYTIVFSGEASSLRVTNE